MLASDEAVLRSFCARILGWTHERASAVEHAIRSIHLSVTYRSTLVLLGEIDLVPIAHALHTPPAQRRPALGWRHRRH